MKYYVVQRCDTGEYFKRTKSRFLKDWSPDDPRLKNWTNDLELATLYTFAGAKSIHSNCFVYDAGKRIEIPNVIVRLKLSRAGVVNPSGKE